MRIGDQVARRFDCIARLGSEARRTAARNPRLVGLAASRELDRLPYELSGGSANAWRSPWVVLGRRF